MEYVFCVQPGRFHRTQALYKKYLPIISEMIALDEDDWPNIHLDETYTDGPGGYYHDANTIVINPDRFKLFPLMTKDGFIPEPWRIHYYDMFRFKPLNILAHELVHARQKALKQMLHLGSTVKWQIGQEYQEFRFSSYGPVQYKNFPWEKEANRESIRVVNTILKERWYAKKKMYFLAQWLPIHFV